MHSKIGFLGQLSVGLDYAGLLKYYYRNEEVIKTAIFGNNLNYDGQ
jgi:hypothetical protein